MVTHDVIVVGAGVIGTTIAKALKRHGRTVSLYNKTVPNIGTAPSGGHIKPSWCESKLKGAPFDAAMEMLEATWPIKEESFWFRNGKRSETMFRVDIDALMSQATAMRLEIAGIKLHDASSVQPRLTITNRASPDNAASCKLLIIAAGVWTKEILGDLFPWKLQGKSGVSFRFNGTTKSFIETWAPYKQVVAHQQSPGEIWVGDGSAVLEANWTAERTQACFERCAAAINNHNHRKTLYGIRPYCRAKGPCLLERIGPSCWVATGAGKLGTIASAWAAKEIIDASC